VFTLYFTRHVNTKINAAEYLCTIQKSYTYFKFKFCRNKPGHREEFLVTLARHKYAHMVFHKHTHKELHHSFTAVKPSVKPDATIICAFRVQTKGKA